MDFLNAKDRLTTPLKRENNEFAAVAWDDALEQVARQLSDIKTNHGPQSIAFMGSTKCTNEENYLFQKIARTHLKTNNIDNGGYLSGRQILSMIDKRADTGGRFNFFAGPLSGGEVSRTGGPLFAR